MVSNGKETQGQQRKKTNQAFMILSAIGILFVIDSHCGSYSGMTRIFPYGSFCMPMFIFISGYFFREEQVFTGRSFLNFLVKKVKKLLLPFTGWMLFYCLLTFLLNRLGASFYRPSLKGLLRDIFFYGISYGFNDPSWFIITLFWVNVIQASLRFLFKNHWNDFLCLVAYLLLGLVAVFLAHNGLLKSGTHVLVAKVLFFLQFFQIGACFKKYWETYLDAANTTFVLTICVAINLVLLMIYGDDICFPNCAFMSGFHCANIMLPLVTSLVGTTFYLKLSKALVPLLGNNKLVNFISNNTYFIMTNHLLAKLVANLILLFIMQDTLDHAYLSDMISSVWFAYAEARPGLIAMLMATAIALMACVLYRACKSRVTKAFANLKSRAR